MMIKCAKGEIKDPKRFVKKCRDHFIEEKVLCQVVDSRAVIGKTHIMLALEQAQRRFNSDRAISRSLEVEFLLYLTATHQIEVALDRGGVNENTSDMLFIFLEGDCDLGPLFKELELKEQDPVYCLDLIGLLNKLDIQETSNPEDAVYEAMALVNLEK